MQKSSVRAVNLAGRRIQPTAAEMHAMQAYARANPEGLGLGGWIHEHPFLTFFLGIFTLGAISSIFSGRL